MDILKLLEKVEDVRPFLGTASWEVVNERLKAKKPDTDEALPPPTD